MSNEEKINKTELTSRFLDAGYTIDLTMAQVDIAFPPGPYEDFKKGDRVITNLGFRRIFSHVNKHGIPYIFVNGRDEWLSRGDTEHITSCTLWKEGD
jgi:hypothetical protein